RDFGDCLWRGGLLFYEPDRGPIVGGSKTSFLGSISHHRIGHSHGLRWHANLAHYSVVFEVASILRSLRNPSRMVVRSPGLASLNASTRGWIESAGSVFCMNSCTC